MRVKILFGIGALFLASVVIESLRAADEPAAKSQVQRGQDLVTYGTCADCHTPKLMTERGPVPDLTRNLSGFPQDKKLPAIPPNVVGPGGWGVLGSDDFTAWAGPWGISFAANLTPDKETGLGSWTPEQFMSAMRTGRHQGDGRTLLPPMPWYGMSPMPEEDLRAIFAYLQSLPPIKNKVPEPLPPET